MLVSSVIDGPLRFGAWILAPVIMLLLLLPGCWVEAINPLYEDHLFQSKDPDLAFDPILLGSWALTYERCTTTLTITAKDDVYQVRSTEQGEGCGSAGEESRQQARLVKLDTHYFLDVSPLQDDVCNDCLAKHTIYQTKINKDSFSLTPIDSDWLVDAVKQNKVALHTTGDDGDLLTSSSADLKAFCRKYADDPAVFKPNGPVFKRN